MNKGDINRGRERLYLPDEIPWYRAPRGARWFARATAAYLSGPPDVIDAGGRKFEAWKMGVLGGGKIMEETVEKLNEINKELLESKRIIADVSNELTAMSKVVQPQMERQIEQLRAMRMTVVQELELSLKSLREVRRFFLDNDYRTEIDRLKEFAALCERLKALKESGFFDAMCDSAIRLALKETE